MISQFGNQILNGPQAVVQSAQYRVDMRLVAALGQCLLEQAADAAHFALHAAQLHAFVLVLKAFHRLALAGQGQKARK